MMSQPFFIFPHQLFDDVFTFGKETEFYLIEDDYFFLNPERHPFQRILCRAGLQALRERLLVAGYVVHYFPAAPIIPENRPLEQAFKRMRKSGDGVVEVFDPLYPEIAERLQQQSARSGWVLSRKESPALLLNAASKKSLLKKGALTPSGITHAFAKKYGLPSSEVKEGVQEIDSSQIPAIPLPDHSRYVDEAIEYESRHFSTFIKQLDLHSFFYPVTHDDANDWLDSFILERLPFFGTMRDQVHADHPFIFASVLSPLLAIGLITPHQVLTRIGEVAPVLHADEAISCFLHLFIGVREYAHDMVKSTKPREAGLMPSPDERALFMAVKDRQSNLIIQRLIHHGYAHQGELAMLWSTLKKGGLSFGEFQRAVSALHLGYPHPNLVLLKS